MIYKSVGIEGYLRGRSRNPYIGKEYQSQTFVAKDIKLLWSEDKYSLRIIYHYGKKNVSVIHIALSESPVIMNMYTLKNFRRKGILTKIYKLSKLMYPNISFSDNLSEDGEAFVNSLNKV